MHTKVGMITIELPHLDLMEVPILMVKFEEFINSLRKENFKSEFEHYHINAEMDHYEGIEMDDDGDGDGEPMPIPRTRKRKPVEHLKVVES